MAEKVKKNCDISPKIDDPEYQCGFYYRIPYLQRFATAAWFTGFFVLPQLTSQSLYMYINSQIPTLERQFSLSSYESGIIMTFNDIGFLLAGMLVASIPKLVHIPRWLFGAIIIYAVSSLLCSLPHFIINSKQDVTDTTLEMANTTKLSKLSIFPICSDLVNSDKSNTTMENKPRLLNSAIDQSLKSLSVGLIGIGLGLQGAAKSIRTPFLTQYLDEENKDKTGFYLGILMSASVLGPVLAFVLGGIFSRIYVTLEDVDMSTKDPRWIGAWWLGFIVVGTIALICAFPLICFPRHLAEKIQKKEKEEENLVMKHENQNSLEVESLKKTSKIEIFKERSTSYIRVMKSPMYLCLLTAFVLNVSSVCGPVVFKSKYIVAQFGLPLWKANLIISAVMVATLSLGSFFGGYITKKFKLSPRMLIVVTLILHAGTTFFFGGAIFVGCDQPQIIGPNMSHSIVINMTEDCHCDPKDYFPVCGSDGRNFHSPCYAGCKEVARNGRMYANCTVIPDGQTSAGLCPFECNALIPYLLLNVFGYICGSMNIIPMFMATIRSVEDRDKSTAAGLKSVSASLLAFIPAPIVFGKVIDKSCILWNSDRSRKGSCSLYNIAELRIGMFGTGLLYRAAALFFMLLALWKVWSIKDWNELRKKKTDHIKMNGYAEKAVSAEH
ncbi:solute carrier organic anion transporter family member 2A1-like [Mytilus californianus]|uniref:solute carrier organic anion transporter family member 2A1-like n=1 Tax=Mytilus californianus TaxID=6549 RepID=UPI0022473C9F|nr:solute carrier organic anion transporter family member 2A1-like [Mytilus californianus]